MILPEHEHAVEAGLASEQAAWDAAPLPNGVDEAVLRGMLRARRTTRRRSRRAMIAASAAVIIALLLGMVRVSPAFASAVAGLPGLSGIVSLVAGDQGLEGAVSNDYVQPVDAGDSHDGVTFAVKGIIADDTRLNVFYTVKLPSAASYVPYEEPRMYDADTGEALPVSISFGAVDTSGKPKKAFQERMDVSISAGHAMPERVRMSVKLMGYPEEKTWNVVIPIDKARFADMKETIPLAQTVTVQGQRMRFAQAVVHPTSITVDVAFDEANSMKLFSLSDLRIVTDTGEVLRSYGSTQVSPDKMKLQFESAFFAKPKHLTLIGSKIMALDKSKLELALDLGQQRLVKSPDDRVRFIAAEKTGADVYTVKLGVKTNRDRDNFNFTIVDGAFHDAAGTEFQFGSLRTSTDNGADEDEVITTFEAKLDKPFTNPLTFPIVNYPSWIEQPFEVKLK
ncbi:DUF4179 domain-containing protein [Paenibacillus rhizovicinus]|uniref:DUF4179 domain-containing protein n=1 Tax=Paenibacillus rhizovicinus TaxID=2704463 RepID=A0A6C0NZU7_9BACL|nr:DUF4179 domain-containing protein [Paenibacillus rhizovicinus]QHW31476.1 DUF4179 domain-containing protein [Paenibacillus rhizovicinus]